MTYRHSHCVFCEYKGNDKYYCLKHDKHFPAPVMLPVKKDDKIINHTEGWFQPHCEDMILKPELLISHIYANENKCSWEEADKYANKMLKKYGFSGMKL